MGRLPGKFSPRVLHSKEKESVIAFGSFETGIKKKIG